MFRTKGNFAVVLLVVFVSLSLALPRVEETVRKSEKAVAGTKPNAERGGRFLLPADFAVKKKKYTIGGRGEGSFFRAWRNCIEEGKGLATIESAEEQAFLESMLQSIPHHTRYWIAATNLGATDKTILTWVTTDLRVETTPDSTSLAADKCFTLSPSGSWKKNNCFSSSHPYLCEEYY